MRRASLPSLLVLVAACAPALAVSPLPPPTTAPDLPPVPPGPLTLAQAGLQADWMDPAADPCQDFFAYACGGFVKTSVIPADRSSWGASDVVEKQNEEFLHDVLERASRGAGGEAAVGKIGDYYAACMDEEGIERLGLSPIGPLLALAAGVRDERSLGAAVSSLHAQGIFPLFEISSQQDFKDATVVIASLDQGGLGLPDRDYYLKDDGNLKDVRQFYTRHVGRMLGLVGVPVGEVPAAVDDVMRIETRLAKLAQDKVARRDPYKIYHRVDRAGLPGLAPAIAWDAYFQELRFPGIVGVTVNDPAYFAGVSALMRQEKPAAWRHYLTWQIARAEAPHLTRPLVAEGFALAQKLSGQKELEPRWKRCVKAVDANLGELLAQPYVAARFAGDSKERARALVEAIDDAMKADLSALTWMDEGTRQAALAKLAKVRHVKVGYPDSWRVYDFAITRDAYAKDAMAARRFELARMLAKVGKPVDRGEWQMTPPTVNAYYDPSMNEMVLPAGELQPPFFSREFYAPVNLGATGAATIGHELTHGFDDEGSQFDGDGNLRDWWTKKTKASFDEATRCVQDQYSQYEAVPGVKLNGALTSGENIADIGGVKLGYAALEAWAKAHPDERRQVEGFTDEKLYFLGYAQSWCTKQTPAVLERQAHTDPHSPARWRVNGPMADEPAFAAAFQCSAGAPMNPGKAGKACTVW